MLVCVYENVDMFHKCTLYIRLNYKKMLMYFLYFFVQFITNEIWSSIKKSKKLYKHTNQKTKNKINVITTINSRGPTSYTLNVLIVHRLKLTYNTMVRFMSYDNLCTRFHTYSYAFSTGELAPLPVEELSMSRSSGTPHYELLDPHYRPLEAPVEVPTTRCKKKKQQLALSGEKVAVAVLVSLGLWTSVSLVEVLDNNDHHPNAPSWLLILHCCFGLEDRLHNYVDSCGFQCITFSMIS